MADLFIGAMSAMVLLALSSASPPLSQGAESLSLTQARQVIAGKTVVTFVETYQICDCPAYPVPDCTGCANLPGPGTLVEFFAEDGRSFLWQPESPGVVTDEWALGRSGKAHELCFWRSADRRMPVYVQSGDEVFNPHCLSFPGYLDSITEIAAGDPFDLAGGRVPFVLGGDRTTVEDLLKRR